MKQSKLFYKTIKSLIFITFNVILLTFFSCSNVISTRNNETTDSKVSTKAQLSLSIENNSKRTILPEEDYFEDMEYVLEGFFEDSEQQENDDSTEDLESTDQENNLESTNSQKPTIKKEWNSYSEMTADNNIQIDEGNWTFKLYVGRNGNVLYTGEITMNVKSGTNHLVFTLTETSYSLENGSGAAEVTLMLPNDAEIKKVEAGLLTIDYESVENFDFSELEIDRWNTVTYSAEEIPSGVYIVQFKFYSEIGEIEPGFSELIQIKDGRTSRATRKIKNLAKLHSIKYENINGAIWADGYTLRGTLNKYECITLPTASEISMPDCTFGGWFSDADYSGTAITEIPAGTLENVTIYAKWVYNIESANIASKVTAIAYDGKVHISWVATKSDNYTNATVYLVSGTEKEKIGVTENHTSSVYGTYSYLCYEKPYMNFDGVKFEVHAVHKCGAESENYVEVVGVESSIPIVTIDTENSVDVKDRTNKIPATMNILNSSNPLENASLTIKGRGNSSWGMAKKSYTLKLANKDKILGMKKHKTWALIANYSDKTLLRNSIAYQMGREIFTNMSWNPSTKNVHFILNGEYLGLYMLTESVKIDENRVNIPNIEKCKDTSKASEYGFLLEINQRLDESFNFKTTKELCISLKDPDGEDISAELQQIIQETTQKAEYALYSDDFTDSTSENFYENYFDVDSFIDWWLVNEIAKNRDASFFSSCYLYFNPVDQKLHMGPLWDFDIGFGNDGESNAGQTSGFRIKNATWIARMFKDTNFTTRAKTRWNEKHTELLEFFDSDVKNQFGTLTSDANVNFARWTILGTKVWPNPDGYADRKTYKSECDFFNDWISARIEWLDTAINEL